MGYLEYLTLQWLVVRYLEESRNFVVALYAADIANNNTLLCRAIKFSTIKSYLRAAASLSAAARCLDPQLHIYGRRSAYINKVLLEVKR